MLRFNLKRFLSISAIKESYPTPLYFNTKSDRLFVSFMQHTSSTPEKLAIGSFQKPETNDADLTPDNFEENPSFKGSYVPKCFDED